MELTAEQRAAMLNLARAVIRQSLGESIEIPECSEPAFNRPAGCFVTLHAQQSHRLRGCIGQLIARESLWQTVAEMAAAVLQDPRFRTIPVTLSELPRLDLEITVLSPLQPAADPFDFDLLNDGIYLQVDGESGCFLPQVARETGWTKEQLLARLCEEKMGLSPRAFRQAHARLFRFTTLIVGPEPVLLP